MTSSKTLYVLVLGICLLPVFVKKHLKELTIVSIILFFGVACFVVIISAQLLVEGNFANPDDNQTYKYLPVQPGFDFVKGVSIILVATAF